VSTDIPDELPRSICERNAPCVPGLYVLSGWMGGDGSGVVARDGIREAAISIAIEDERQEVTPGLVLGWNSKEAFREFVDVLVVVVVVVD
jgi:hypothetical protein